MDIKSSVGICTKLQDFGGKLVVIPQDSDMFEENQIVVLLAAKDFESFTDEIKALVKFVESAQKVSEDE